MKKMFERKELSPEQVQAKEEQLKIIKACIKGISSVIISCVVLYCVFNSIRIAWIEDRAMFFSKNYIAMELMNNGVGDSNVSAIKTIKISHNKYQMILKVESKETGRKANMIMDVWVIHMCRSSDSWIKAFRTDDTYECRISPNELEHVVRLLK